MHETYREYLEHQDRRFLIIVFKSEKRYFLKVFLHRMVVYQLPFDISHEDINSISQLPVSAFEKFIEIAREWILENY